MENSMGWPSQAPRRGAPHGLDGRVETVGMVSSLKI